MQEESLRRQANSQRTIVRIITFMKMILIYYEKAISLSELEILLKDP